MKLIKTETITFGGYTEFIYTVDEELKKTIDKFLIGNITSYFFTRKNEEGNYEIKPATIGDHHLIKEIFKVLLKKQTNKLLYSKKQIPFLHSVRSNLMKVKKKGSLILTWELECLQIKGMSKS